MDRTWGLRTRLSLSWGIGNIEGMSSQGMIGIMRELCWEHSLLTMQPQKCQNRLLPFEGFYTTLPRLRLLEVRITRMLADRVCNHIRAQMCPGFLTCLFAGKRRFLILNPEVQRCCGNQRNTQLRRICLLNPEETQPSIPQAETKVRLVDRKLWQKCGLSARCT